MTQLLEPPTPSWQSTPPTWKPRQVGRPPEPQWGESGNGWLFRIAIGAVVAAVLMPFLVVLILYTMYKGLLSSDLPKERPSVVSGITRLYDDGGRQIGLLREFDLSIPVEQADIPDVLKQAVVAAEDRRFYSHSGVDDRAVFRALWSNLTGGGYVEGASTLTQQYARLVYLDPAKTLSRKIQEAAIARRLEKEMSKDEILYRYLDRAYLGSGAYGVGAASQTYFRKSVRDLNLSEAALLAGLIRQPSVNDPRTNPSGAEAVRMQVLGQMRDQGRITDAQYSEAATQRLVLVTENFNPDGAATRIHPPLEQQSEYPYFTDYVRRYLVAKYGDEMVYRGGLKVTTSLNPSLQAKAEAAVKEALSGTSAPLEMAMVSVDPRTGLVRALVGGRDFAKSQVNLALGNCAGPVQPKPNEPFCVDGGGTGRQPGSAFKPVTLAEALEQGIPVTEVYSGPSSYRFRGCRGGDAAGCVVSNVESSGYGALSLRQATAYSVNTVYAQLIEDVGTKETAEMANRLGLTMINPEGKLPNGELYGPSLTLGAAEVSPLDMASAYGAFANRGMLMAASPVVRVEDGNGKVLEEVKAKKAKRVLPEPIADTINDVLSDTVAYGTGTAADIGRPAGTAGKTGTSEDYGDAWFVGYTPELSTSVWMGYADSRKSLVNIKGHSRVYGGTMAAPTWKAYMESAAPELNLTDFAKPTPPTTVATIPPVPVAPVAPPPTVDVQEGTTPTSQFTVPTFPRTTPTTRTSPTSIYRAPPTSRVTLPLPTTPTTRSPFGNRR
ncbi:MAG: transglycosylase domain-containing protein [Acidimicrobiia bacterium]